MGKDLVVFKNSPDRLLILMEDDVDFSEILQEIYRKISKNRGFFKGATLKLRYKGRDVGEEEENQIVQMFEESGAVTVIDIGREITLEENSLGNDFRGIAYGLFDEGQKNPVKETSNIKKVSEGITSYYKGDLCKGQRINYRGTVVVFGDVKKGAEITAAENIIVFGKIKGSVSAGRNLKTAVIICEELLTDDFTIMGMHSLNEGFKERYRKLSGKGFFRKKKVNMKILSLDEKCITVDSWPF